MDNNPQNRFASVIVFGIFCLIAPNFLQYYHEFSVNLVYKYTIMKLKLITVFFFFIFQHSYTIAQTKYSNDFLNIGAGARSLSLSKSVVASLSDPSSVYWNPSLLVNINNSEIEFMHAEYFAGIANYDQVSYVNPINDKEAIGGMILRFGVDDIMNTSQLIDNEGNVDYNRIELFSTADYAFLFSYARNNLFAGFNAGGNMKIIYRHIGDFAKSWGFGFDLSLYKKYGNWSFGAIARDVTSTFNSWMFDMERFEDIYDQTGNELPQNSTEITLPSMQTGIARSFKLNDRFSGHSEIDLTLFFDGNRNVLFSGKTISLTPHMGTEILYMDIVAIRFGVGNFRKELDFNNESYISMEPNIGLGFTFNNYTIDYALTDLGDFSSGMYSNIFSLRYHFR